MENGWNMESGWKMMEVEIWISQHLCVLWLRCCFQDQQDLRKGQYGELESGGID